MEWTHAAPILQAIAWPVAIVIILVALRVQISEFFKSFGHRVTSLGFGTFSVELEATKATAFSVDWKISNDDARRLTSSAIFASASGDLFNQIAHSKPADYSIIDLEKGEGWLTSRLFIFAVILGELGGARTFVFVETKGYQHQVYIGHATLDVVRDVLGRAFPWFEVALAETVIAPVLNAKHADTRPEVLSLDSCDLDRLANIVQGFVENIQRAPAEEGNFNEPEWLEFKDSAEIVHFERAEWLNSVRLRRVFGDNLQRQFFVDDPEKAAADRAASIVARKGDFVATVDAQERLQGLIDRRALLDRLSPQLARLLGEK